MPIFYQTSGGTVKRDPYDCGFTTVWRAKDKGTRIRIAAIGKAVVECGGVKYSQPARHVLADRIKKGGTYAARLKIAKTKSRGATTDCTGFAGACMYGAMHPMLIRGWMPDSRTLCSTPDGTFAHYKKLKYKNQLQKRTLQRGDIVAKNGHGAVVAESMSGINEQEYFFKHYYPDGSKKNTYKKKKSEKIRKNVKKYKKTIKKKAKKSKQALKNYLKTLEKQKKTIKDKWKKYKNKKNKSKAQQVYQDRLKDTLDKIEKAITATEKAIKDYKEPKKRPKKKKAKKKNKNTKKGSNQTTTNNNNNTNNNTNNNGQPDEYTYEIESINTEPIIIPEKIDWYYIRSGLNYFSEEEIYDSKNQKVRHKDYMGIIYCKRKIKIPTIDITSDYWEFNFDMPFNTCNSFSAGIKRAEKVNGDNTQWRYYLNKNGVGQIQGGAYTIKMKTKVGIEYEIRCEITTYYNE